MDHEPLIQRAKTEHGELIQQIVRYPDGGINVRLVGGEYVQYWPDGAKNGTWSISWLTKLMRFMTKRRSS